MADTKEQLLEKLQAVRKVAPRLATIKFGATKTFLIFFNGYDTIELCDVGDAAAAVSLAAALQAEFAKGIALLDLKTSEATLVDAYKSATGAEDVKAEDVKAEG